MSACISLAWKGYTLRQPSFAPALPNFTSLHHPMRLNPSTWPPCSMLCMPRHRKAEDALLLLWMLPRQSGSAAMPGSCWLVPSPHGYFSFTALCTKGRERHFLLQKPLVTSNQISCPHVDSLYDLSVSHGAIDYTLLLQIILTREIQHHNMTTVGLFHRAMNSEDNRQSEPLRSIIPCIVLATMAVMGRIFSNRFRPTSYGADDYTIILALVSVLTLSNLSLIENSYCFDSRYLPGPDLLPSFSVIFQWIEDRF